MFQCWFAPVIFLHGTAVSCLLLVKHYDQRCRLPYQKPSGHSAVISSCSLFATSRLFPSSRTTWATPHQRIWTILLYKINQRSRSEIGYFIMEPFIVYVSFLLKHLIKLQKNFETLLYQAKVCQSLFWFTI